MTATVLRTVADRGKQHNPVTGSGGMLLGKVLQIAPGRPAEQLAVGDRVATLVSLSLTPLRIDSVGAVRPASAQMDVHGEAVLFASGAYAKLPADLPERLALAALDVAGAAPQVARLVKPGAVVVVLGAGGKSGILCAAEARRTGGKAACVVGLEASTKAAEELRALGLCDAVAAVDARDPVAVRRTVLEATGGREADVTFSCVNVPDVELSAILATRDRGVSLLLRDVHEPFTQGSARRRGRGSATWPSSSATGTRTGTPSTRSRCFATCPRCGSSSSAATAEGSSRPRHAHAQRGHERILRVVPRAARW